MCISFHLVSSIETFTKIFYSMFNLIFKIKNIRKVHYCMNSVYLSLLCFDICPSPFSSFCYLADFFLLVLFVLLSSRLAPLPSPIHQCFHAVTPYQLRFLQYHPHCSHEPHLGLVGRQPNWT